MSRFVVDCSVAVKWYFSEPDGAAALRLLADDHEFLAPEFVRLEFAAVAWKKARRNELTPAEVTDALAAFPPPVVALAADASLLSDALQFAIQNDTTVYDSLYAVLALGYGAPLVTNDAHLHAIVAAHAPALALFPSDVEAPGDEAGQSNP